MLLCMYRVGMLVILRRRMRGLLPGDEFALSSWMPGLVSPLRGYGVYIEARCVSLPTSV